MLLHFPLVMSQSLFCPASVFQSEISHFSTFTLQVYELGEYHIPTEFSWKISCCLINHSPSPDSWTHTHTKHTQYVCVCVCVCVCIYIYTHISLTLGIAAPSCHDDDDDNNYPLPPPPPSCRKTLILWHVNKFYFSCTHIHLPEDEPLASKDVEDIKN